MIARTEEKGLGATESSERSGKSGQKLLLLRMLRRQKLIIKALDIPQEHKHNLQAFPLLSLTTLNLKSLLWSQHVQDQSLGPYVK